MRIAVVQRRLAHFRVPFFRRLGKQVELDVVCSPAGRGDEGFLEQPPADVPFRTLMVDRLSLTARERGVWIRPQAVLHLMRHRYDAVIFETSLTLTPEIAVVMAMRRVAGVPTLLWGSGWQPDEAARLTQLRTALHRGLIATADGVIAYSDAAADWFRSCGARLVEVAPNAADGDGLAAFQEVAARDPQAVAAARARHDVIGPYVIHVGTMRPSKRIDVLLDAWARVPNRRGHQLVMVGGGPMLEELKRYAAERGVPDVRWLGPVYDSFELHALFAGARCFVLPGTGGLAINQALGVGTPAIVSRADGTERGLVIDAVTGLFFPPGDVGALAEVVERVLADDALHRSLSASARRQIDDKINMSAMEAGFLRAVNQCAA